MIVGRARAWWPWRCWDFLLFNYPFLALVSDERRVLGIPVLYAYLFLSWAVLIALLALVVRKSE